MVDSASYTNSYTSPKLLIDNSICFATMILYICVNDSAAISK